MFLLLSGSELNRLMPRMFAVFSVGFMAVVDVSDCFSVPYLGVTVDLQMGNLSS